jgi:rSAM/selenodomain-associated transferase 1
MGAVKTRLAATMGNERAFDIYNRLSLHTKEITRSISADKIVCYSEHIETVDLWPIASYRKGLQEGFDLGERMMNAFASGFKKRYDAICVIGTDCFELTATLIEEAFDALKSHDAVIGPARDGGYYLLGMRQLHSEIFAGKQWSTDSVFQETIRDFETLGLTYVKLKTLRDVDVEGDLPDELKPR